MGLGLAHYIPLLAYLGFWIMSIRSLMGRPDLGLYYAIPFLPYRTLRDRFIDYPLGTNVLTILVVAIIVGALMQGRRLPKTKLYGIWLLFGIYLYVSMWFGTALGNAPPPLWLSDVNFVTWKDYMMMPLLFVAAGLVLQDRKSIRTVILLGAVTLVAIDRSALMSSLSRSWTTFDETKRDGGPLGFQSNELAAYLAQFGMFFWGFGQFLRKKWKLIAYGVSAVSLFATMYTFSRGAYLAALVGVFVLGVLKDRKLILIGAIFLVTWQVLVPAAVVQRVDMTKNANGQLEASAQERVDLWENAKNAILSDPIFGMGYATFQLGTHVDNLKDTHNWYVKVMVETGAIGMIFALALIQQMVAAAYRLFRHGTDPMYRGLGLGLVVAMSSCLVANCFGDRWTYIEINGILWVLIAAAVRASYLVEEPVAEIVAVEEAMPLHLQTGFR